MFACLYLSRFIILKLCKGCLLICPHQEQHREGSVLSVCSVAKC